MGVACCGAAAGMSNYRSGLDLDLDRRGSAARGKVVLSIKMLWISKNNNHNNQDPPLLELKKLRIK